MKITNIQKTRLEQRKKRIEEDLVSINVRLKEAIEHGDLSENSEYDEAKQARAIATHNLRNINIILKEADIIEPSMGATIEIGSILKVTDLERNAEQILLLSDEGDPIIDGILSTDSILGSQVVNNTSGTYSVVVKGQTISYNVVKLIGKQAEELFTKVHPEESEIFAKYFE
ncbi:MAG: hypothetical protein E7H54_04980 [Clostridium perfringens]|uniref:GreA/GreB family elongation factor n=1 Tax=Clostridium perfringens TaxID=1502 RepID=UPI0024BCC7D4|nr:hypothetical protein [Clostridium perfringens]MDU8988515.1 hypothetical protein [Clostridium perfringens]